jgi:SAM-dependent methyltransferase
MKKSFWEFAYKVRYESRISLAQTRREVSFLHHFLPRNGDVLDFACGHGRHAILLSSHNRRVHGFDNDADSIRRARVESQSITRERRPFYVRENLLKFDRKEKYDGAICMYSSIGPHTDAENSTLFCNFLRSVRPGGIAVLDLINPAWAVRNARPITKKILRYRGDIYKLIHERHLAVKPMREMNTITISSVGKQTKTYTYSLRLYRRSEIAQIFALHGFRVMRSFGSFQMHAVSSRQQRLIVVAHRR